MSGSYPSFNNKNQIISFYDLVSGEIVASAPDEDRDVHNITVRGLDNQTISIALGAAFGQVSDKVTLVGFKTETGAGYACCVNISSGKVYDAFPSPMTTDSIVWIVRNGGYFVAAASCAYWLFENGADTFDAAGKLFCIMQINRHLCIAIMTMPAWTKIIVPFLLMVGLFGLLYPLVVWHHGRRGSAGAYAQHVRKIAAIALSRAAEQMSKPGLL